MSTRSASRRLASLLVAVLAVVFVVSGAVLTAKGVDGRNQVAAQLKQEHIKVSPDAPKAYAGKLVVDGPTAQAEADVIWHHMLKASGGRTYAQISSKSSEADLKVRSTLQVGDSLRSALLASALAWNIANLAIGLGALLLGTGGVILLVTWLRRERK